MSKFTKEMVDDYANKLLIGLTEEENKLVLDEFEQIDKQIDLINEIPNIENVTPMTHALDNFVTFLRDDEAKTSDDIDDILANAKDVEGREIQIPKVVD
ncbi:MAG: Asp-tRNA(Asn)/Glu-tRNA(Gln) amidotransferase subunit GatC [Bacilli bacterium]|nr:Asp-tRNA(Asn)/Glu-tRNA(Gln) amidotransferase subunit GatC [Bacilli bacterium]MBQ9834628.1 Asp-tRNA(Asn)/Glu-tRNA(Gln) amidotransferase subunit GatC [Bacilli bacterium]